ncbi:MAG: hypothetical protein JOY99_13705 [Sphingomonadaceae bacterium]|nr:hypothetical protein [Sphingomonadaceae bacterium]
MFVKMTNGAIELYDENGEVLSKEAIERYCASFRKRRAVIEQWLVCLLALQNRQRVAHPHHA